MRDYTTQLTVLPTESQSLTDVEVERAKKASRNQASAEAKNTTRAYGGQMKIWQQWCRDNGKQPLPADPKDFSDWLTERAEAGISPATLAIAVAAIKFTQANAHGIASFDDRATWMGLNHETGLPEMTSFRRVWSGIRRTYKRPQKQARALSGEILADVLKHLTRRGASFLDCRDACMLAIGYVFALRRSELATIDYMQTGVGLERGNGVLTINDDSATLTLLSSKTNQEGDAEDIIVMRDANPRAFAALERWIKVAGIEPGTPLLRRITPRRTVAETRISDDGVHRAVKAVMFRHYLSHGTNREIAKKEAAKFSGHSARVGFVVAAKEGGANDTDIMATTRHTSTTMIARYGRKADQKRRAVHKLAGVGL